MKQETTKLIIRSDRRYYETAFDIYGLLHLIELVKTTGHNDQCGYCHDFLLYAHHRLRKLRERKVGHPVSSCRKTEVDECQEHTN